jgi:hypothetical protein
MKFLTDFLACPAEAEPLPAPFQPLRETDLLIVVGLTGVGKSTVTDGLRGKINFTLLPNRRELTDAIIIAQLQEADGQPIHPVTDRLLRFEYTARYRQLHSGGMVHALSQLAIDSTRAAGLLIFDGLRGLNEVEHAVAALPRARLVVLDAPDEVRLSRLLTRGDAFDRAEPSTQPLNHDLAEALRGVDDIEQVLSAEEQAQIIRLADASGIAPAEVAQKAAIIVKERRNYDSRAARDFLTRALPPEQVLVINTSQFPPQAVTARVQHWLE